MDFRGAIESAGAMGNVVVHHYLEDLSDADLLIRPAAGCNHIAWQLGHVIVSNAFLLNLVSPGKAPSLPANFAERHSKESNQSDDPAAFDSKAQYLELIDAIQASLKTALADMTETQLDEPAPERFRARFPTVGHMLLLVANHLLMHAGQFAVVRRKLGKPVVI
jgi:uncharacterized damage-inducible protein DinB